MTQQSNNVWNTMVAFIDTTKDETKKHQAIILLKQYNTAGGLRIKNELVNFLNQNKNDDTK